MFYWTVCFCYIAVAILICKYFDQIMNRINTIEYNIACFIVNANKLKIKEVNRSKKWKNKKRNR